MSKPNRDVIERYFRQLWSEGRLELVDELLHPDYVNHSPGSPDLPRGRDGVRQVVQALRHAFPDLRYTIEDLVVSDEAVASRTTLTGTHRGDLFGIAPTARPIRVSQMTIEHFRDGQIISHHRQTDDLSLLRQLGVLPT